MVAMPAAAAAPPRNAVGSPQKSGAAAEDPDGGNREAHDREGRVRAGLDRQPEARRADEERRRGVPAALPAPVRASPEEDHARSTAAE